MQGMFFGRPNERCSKPRSSSSAVFLSDATLPDGSEVTVGSEMIKTWKLRNDGQQAWPEGTTLILKRCKGEFHTSPLPLSRLPNPGEEVEVSAALTALQPGRGSVCYRIVDNAGLPFGVKLWADVVAMAPKKDEVKAQAQEQPSAQPEPVKVESVVEPKIEPKAPSVEPKTPYQASLAALECMGFIDRELNIRILKEENGDLQRAVNRMV